MARFLSASYSAFKKWRKSKPKEQLDEDVVKEIALYTDGEFTNATTITLWYERFKKKFPNGVIPKKKLVRIYEDFFSKKDHVAIADLVLGIYGDNFEALNFKQFMVALYHASPGDVGLFILAFRMFDRDCDGIIRREDVRVTSVKHRIRKGATGAYARIMADAYVDRIFFMLLRNPNVTEIDIYLYANTIFSDHSHMLYGHVVALQIEFSQMSWHVLALLAIANNVRSPNMNSLLPSIPCEEPTGKQESAFDNVSIDGVFKEVSSSQPEPQPGCSHWYDLVSLEDMLKDEAPEENPLRSAKTLANVTIEETPTKVLNVREEKAITLSQVSKVAVVLHQSPSDVKLEEEMLTIVVDDAGGVTDMTMECIGIQDESGDISPERRISDVSDVGISVTIETMEENHSD